MCEVPAGSVWCYRRLELSLGGRAGERSSLPEEFLALHVQASTLPSPPGGICHRLWCVVDQFVRL